MSHCIRNCGRRAKQGGKLCIPCAERQQQKDGERRWSRNERIRYGRVRTRNGESDAERRGRS